MTICCLHWDTIWIQFCLLVERVVVIQQFKLMQRFALLSFARCVVTVCGHKFTTIQITVPVSSDTNSRIFHLHVIPLIRTVGPGLKVNFWGQHLRDFLPRWGEKRRTNPGGRNCEKGYDTEAFVITVWLIEGRATCRSLRLVSSKNPIPGLITREEHLIISKCNSRRFSAFTVKLWGQILINDAECFKALSEQTGSLWFIYLTVLLTYITTGDKSL